jgi:capsid portal protein
MKLSDCKQTIISRNAPTVEHRRRFESDQPIRSLLGRRLVVLALRVLVVQSRYLTLRTPHWCDGCPDIDSLLEFHRVAVEPLGYLELLLRSVQIRDGVLYVMVGIGR